MPPTLGNGHATAFGGARREFPRRRFVETAAQVATDKIDMAFVDGLRKSSSGQLVRVAQVVQLRLAPPATGQPYSASTRGATRKLHSTADGADQETADMNATGMLLLVVGPDSYSTYNLPQAGSVTIGRGGTNQVRIDDPLASRNHARLHMGDVMYIEDLGSVNGTRVKDQPVGRDERIAIAVGETISIGGCVLIIQPRARARPRAPLPPLPPDTLRDERGVTAAPAVVPASDQAMRRIHELAARAAAGTINVLVTGETGVGKELLAETVHRLSPRKDGPYVCLNCAALAETLLESELFGHERGAFTGAVSAKAGLLETAGGGSIFLDEIGELPLPTQAKLLRVIETREVNRIGSLKPRRIDVRLIAATNRDLEAEVARGTFRRDLYFRLNGITLSIPPLRERVGEIPQLAALFMRRICRELDRPEPRLPPAVIALLEGYGWPGNIRELKNMIERAVLLCTGEAIGPEHFPPGKLTAAVTAPEPTPARAPAPPPTDPGDGDKTERERIIDALNACAGNQSRAAKRLGISRRTLVTKLDTHRIPRPKKNLGE
jgi:two-component system response regulator AtoC